MFRKIIRTVFSLLILPLIAISSAQDEVTLLKWAGPPGSKPEGFSEWIKENPYSEEIRIKPSGIHEIDERADKVAIFTESSLAPSIDEEINQLISDLQSDGYSVLNYTMSGGTPDSLRNFLKSLYASDSIEGALFIGNLPIAWYQIKNDYYSYGYAEWPIDLFYMDLDGNWLDTLEYDATDTLVSGQDSIYDTHYGNVAPEIYVGRLITTGIGVDSLLLQNYFRKDSAYRNGSIELQHRALVYVDDDWEYWASQYANAVSLLYSDTMLVSKPESTRASDYRIELDTVRAWVSVFAHSSPSRHQFSYNSGLNVDYYYGNEYNSQNPPANFYNHFACSFARYTTGPFGAGYSIFNQNYGVGALGSTKTGSMLDFSYFYQPLGNGKNLGEAYRDWFNYIAQGGFSVNEISWHYGMTLLGDPFLKPTGHSSGLEEVTGKNDETSLISAVKYSPDNNILVEYSINEKSSVRINIFDISGRLVRKIYSGVREKGKHSISLNGNKLSSGIYFIRIETEEKQSSKSFIIL